MDSDGSLKRRRLNDSSSSPLFATQSPEPNLSSGGKFSTEKDDTFLNKDFDTLSDDGSEDQPEENAYNESDEPFPACRAFDKAVVDLNSRAKSSVQKLSDHLGQYASLSADLKNMQLKAEETLESRTPEPQMIGFVGATGAGRSRSIPWHDSVLTMDRQELTAHFAHRHSRYCKGGKFYRPEVFIHTLTSPAFCWRKLHQRANSLHAQAVEPGDALRCRDPLLHYRQIPGASERAALQLQPLPQRWLVDTVAREDEWIEEGVQLGNGVSFAETVPSTLLLIVLGEVIFTPAGHRVEEL